MVDWYERSLFDPIAADVAASVRAGAAVLDVGCGSGPLAVRLAARHGFNVTGVDIDPAEIERARRRARRSADAGNPSPAFLVGDVAHLPFDDASFDAVVSSYSMHHWANKAAGLADVCRVLRPGGRALIWDLRQGFALFHLRAPDPLAGIAEGPLVLLGVTEWRWPFGFTFTRRLELARPDGEV